MDVGGLEENKFSSFTYVANMTEGILPIRKHAKNNRRVILPIGKVLIICYKDRYENIDNRQDVHIIDKMHIF